MSDPPAGAVELAPAGAGGVRFVVRVKPGGRADRLLGAHNGALKVEVTAAPERGKANSAVIKLLADFLDVRRSEVTIVSGLGNRIKTIVLRGVAVREISDRLRAAGIRVIGELKIEN